MEHTNWKALYTQEKAAREAAEGKLCQAERKLELLRQYIEEINASLQTIKQAAAETVESIESITKT